MTHPLEQTAPFDPTIADAWWLTAVRLAEFGVAVVLIYLIARSVWGPRRNSLGWLALLGWTASLAIGTVTHLGEPGHYVGIVLQVADLVLTGAALRSPLRIDRARRVSSVGNDPDPAAPS